MYCVNCGKEIGDKIGYCGECEAALHKDNLPDVAEMEEKANAIEAEKKESAPKADQPKKKWDKEDKTGGILLIVIKAATLIGIICFFCPFMMVSCGGGTMSVKGTEMVFGSTHLADYMNEDANELYGYDEEDKGPSAFNWFVCLAAICAVSELFTIEHLGLYARGTAILLIIFRLSAKWYYTFNGHRLSEYAYVNVEFGFALYLAIIIFGLISILSIGDTFD